jgi:hypothetical protein
MSEFLIVQSTESTKPFFVYDEATQTLTLTGEIRIYGNESTYLSAQDREILGILNRYIFPSIKLESRFLTIRKLILDMCSLPDETWCSLLLAIMENKSPSTTATLSSVSSPAEVLLEEFRFRQMSLVGREAVEEFQLVIDSYNTSPAADDNLHNSNNSKSNKPLLALVNIIKDYNLSYSYVNGFWDIRYFTLNREMVQFIIDDISRSKLASLPPSDNNNSASNSMVNQRTSRSLIKKLHLGSINVEFWRPPITTASGGTEKSEQQSQNETPIELLTRLAQVLGTTSSLEELHFSCTDICNYVVPDDERIPLLLSEIKHNSHLKVLGFYGREVKQPMLAEYVRHLLQQPSCSIQELYFTAASADQLVIVAQGIAQNRSLLKLHVGWGRIEDLAIKAIAKAVGQHPTIKELDLKNSTIKIQGAFRFAKCLKNNASIEVLNFQRTYLCYGDEYFEDATSIWGFLVYQLYKQPRKHLGFCALLESFQTMPNLRTLLLSDNGIKKKGAFALARKLKTNNCWKKVDLQNNDIGELGGNMLADVITERKKVDGSKWPLEEVLVSRATTIHPTVIYDTVQNRINLALHK